MVIIKRMDKSILKSKINNESDNYQCDVCIDLSNVSSPNSEWNKIRW